MTSGFMPFMIAFLDISDAGLKDRAGHN